MRSGRGWDDVRTAATDARSGAAEIARRAAEGLAAVPASDLRAAVEALLRGHPSMAPLWRLGADVLAADDPRRAARRFVARLAHEPHGIAASTPPLVRGPVVTLSYSSSLVAALAPVAVPVSCARSDPGGEGALTAERLRERGLEAEVVDDADALRLASAGATVVVGADAVGPGGVVNKVGTASLARAAADGTAPCFVVAGSTKFLDRDLPVTEPFERVPLGRFDAFITEAGPLSAADAAWLARRFALDARLVDVLGTIW